MSRAPNIHILDAHPAIRPLKANLLKFARSAVRRTANDLPLTDIDIIIFVNPDQTVREIGGIGGYCPNAHTLEISVDPTHPNIKRAIRNELPGTITHELHHAIRWRGPGYGTTLLEALVTEGLAEQFVYEIYDRKQFPWTKQLPKREMQLLRRKATKEFHSSYDHNMWFFTGSKTRHISKWSGYRLGFEIVGEYLKAHPSKSASGLVMASASSILKQ